MRTAPFEHILNFLDLLWKAIRPPTAECTTQVWVRAPDLAPNTIVHGDARVKISAECPTVDSVSLGLRFKERSFVKALRSQKNLKGPNLGPPTRRYDFLNPSFWALWPPRRFASKSVEEAYKETTTNKALWIVREEERVIFETMQPINIGNRDHGALRDTVHDFSILVPSTNFPPALDGMNFFGISFDVEHETVYAEWIYEYFAQISFSNGTTKEISAGFTAFQPQYDPAHASQVLTPATVELKPVSSGDNTVKYSIEISADSGLTFVAGTKSHIVTAVVTRTGFARTFSAPLNVFPCVRANSSPKWAAEYGMSDFNPGSVHTPTSSVLRAASDGDKPLFHMWSPDCLYQRNPGVSVMMPDSTSDEIQANKVVTTTSAPFTISIDVDDTHIPTFEMYYQTLSNSLIITLETPRGEDEDVDPDVPSGERNGWDSQFICVDEDSRIPDDEYAWVPWVEGEARYPRPKTWRSYSGRVAVVVHPTKEGTPSSRSLSASTGQAVLSDETGGEQRPLIHYLDEGARGPTFVDRNAIHEPSFVDPVMRELHAPILEPVMSSPPEGEVRSHRYYQQSKFSRRPLIYVGETWARKVVNKN